MNNIYTLKHSLPAGFEPVLRLIIEVCAHQQVSYFIAGATARDIVLYNVFGRTPGRQTRDIDTAILVSNWREYETLKQSLISAGLSATRSSHRLQHLISGLPVDIIPFGDIADQGNKIQWPPEHDVIMSVAGFNEAYRAAITVTIDDKTPLKVASMAGLALLKLMAWSDRRALTSKDATDFYTLLTEYEHLQEDRLYETFIPGEQMDHDPKRMGAFLLGYDMSALMSDETAPQIQHIRDETIELLIDAITVRNTTRDAERVTQLLNDFFIGTLHPFSSIR